MAFTISSNMSRKNHFNRNKYLTYLTVVIIWEAFIFHQSYSSTTEVFVFTRFFDLPSFWHLYEIKSTEAAHCRFGNDIRIYFRAAKHIFSTKAKDKSCEYIADEFNFGSFLYLFELSLCYIEVEEAANLFAFFRNNSLCSLRGNLIFFVRVTHLLSTCPKYKNLDCLNFTKAPSWNTIYLDLSALWWALNCAIWSSTMRKSTRWK